jgi:hypothetical protein
MESVVYTVSEVGELLKKNVIRGLKLGSQKITSTQLINLLEENKVKELSDLENVKKLNSKIGTSID